MKVSMFMVVVCVVAVVVTIIQRWKERLAIARNLLDVLDDATIAKKTGLSVADIRSLRTF